MKSLTFAIAFITMMFALTDFFMGSNILATIAQAVASLL